MVVACPMCHVNLDMKQADIERRYGVRHDMPVYYLSDLVGLALGLDEQSPGHGPAFRGEEGKRSHGPNRRLHLLVRREHRPQRRRPGRGRRRGRELPGVRCALTYKYMCSDPGQASIRQKIAAERLTGVVVASCSPHMHLRTFRKAAEREGLNPYLVEMANIREHCSWVHHDRAQATAKAIDLIAHGGGQGPLQPCPGADPRSR